MENDDSSEFQVSVQPPCKNKRFSPSTCYKVTKLAQSITGLDTMTAEKVRSQALSGAGRKNDISARIWIWRRNLPGNANPGTTEAGGTRGGWRSSHAACSSAGKHTLAHHKSKCASIHRRTRRHTYTRTNTHII